MRWIRIGLIIFCVPVFLTSCGEQHNMNDAAPLSADEQNWQQYGVDDPRLLDWMDMHNNTRMEVSESLSGTVEQLDGVADAIVIRTDNNAYVGIKPSEPYGTGGVTSTELSRPMRARVILAVKTANSKIVNVYVSGTPNMYGTLHSYARKLRHGVSERSLVQSFNTRMQQYFPHSELGQ